MNMMGSLYRFECVDSYCTAVGLKKQLSIRENRGYEVYRLRYTQMDVALELVFGITLSLSSGPFGEAEFLWSSGLSNVQLVLDRRLVLLFNTGGG